MLWWQSLAATPVSGRQFCLESLDAFDGKQYAAVAEISLLDAKGQPINQSAWTIAYVSSEEGRREDGQALNAINGQASDFWHTAFGGKTAAPDHPHRLVIDLEKTVEVAGIRYTPRQGADGKGKGLARRGRETVRTRRKTRARSRLCGVDAPHARQVSGRR